ncbi:MAG TPA: DinB family protein [Streptosporangiaceae bacterium]|jgi:uncharacterized damage-inducible protein DinB
MTLKPDGSSQPDGRPDRPVPPLAPDEVVASAGERAILEAFLDLQRAVVVRKVYGLTREQAVRRLVPSVTTLAGLVKHLAAVEREWFGQVLAGDPGSAGAPDEWLPGPVDTIEGLIAGYRRACARSRQIAAALSLDDLVPHPRLGTVTLRWIYVHMIEETARHAGQADILREQTDGATGFDG